MVYAVPRQGVCGMKTVSEVSKLTGISVRTLHYYDEIGLLKPTAATEAGYRMYDDAALERLQSILLFRELRFSLREIKIMLDSPAFDPREALSQQIRMLELERARLDALIESAKELKKTGGYRMKRNWNAQQELENCREEVKQRWGDTAAYSEFKQRGEPNGNPQQLMAQFAAFGALREYSPSDARVQMQVAALQDCISANYYTCTKEILCGLGAMYTADERFRANIDAAGGDGTAEFVSQAIEIYCK